MKPPPKLRDPAWRLAGEAAGCSGEQGSSGLQEFEDFSFVFFFEPGFRVWG